MKKLTLAALCVLGVFALSGCGDKVSLTNEQNDMIAEYVAGSLLKHSYDNEWNYTKLNSAQAATKSSTKATASTGSGMGQTTATTAAGTTGSAASAATGATKTTAATKAASSISEALGLSGVDISYKDISIGDRYPTDAYAVCVPAQSGHKIVAVELTIKNTSGTTVKAVTKNSAVTMKLSLGSSTYSQYKSMLKNDICALDGVSIKPEESYTAAAIFQVPSESAVKTSDMKLEVLSGSQLIDSIKLQ